MTAPLWASLVLAAFGALAILFQTQPRPRAFAVLAFGLSHFGGFAGAYSILLVIALISMILIWKTDTRPVTAGDN